MLFLLLPLLLVSCTSSTQPKAPQKVVYLATWPNYLSEDVLTQFTQKTGIKVEISHFSSNEEVLAKLQAGASGYDLIMPSDYMVLVMKKLGLLQPIQKEKISHIKELDPQIMGKSFDPKNEFSLPYDWGTTGIAVQRSTHKGPMKKWKDLFSIQDLNGRVTLLDDVRETLGAALRALGYSVNSTNPQEIEKAKDLILSAKPKLRGFTSEVQQGLVEHEMVVAHSYVTDALMANRTLGGGIEYILPEEGCTLWIDHFVIPKEAPHVEYAHQLMDHLLSAEAGQKTVEAIFVAPANRLVMNLIAPDLKKNTSLFPPEKVLKKCQMIEDLGDKIQLWDRAWAQIKSGSGG